MKVEGFGGVKFWINRVAEEHSEIAKFKIDKARTLFFQYANFDKMGEEIQEKVIEDLLKDIKVVFGEEEYNRIKQEYFTVEKQEVKA